MGCKVTPAIKRILKERFPKQKSEYDGNIEDDWEWMDRVCENLGLDYIDLETKKIIGVSLASDGDDADYSMAELQETVTKIQKLFGEDTKIKLYMGTEMC